MKKSIQANISGRIYNIDEDAYTLLNNYLTELRNAFNTPDGLEIVNDIEARIAEIFAARPDTIIIIDDVNDVIERMGRPDQLAADYPDMSAHDEQTPPPFNRPAEAPREQLVPAQRKFYRSTTNRVFGGVLGGLATYLDWDVTLLRVLVVIFAICTAVWPCIVIYLVVWMIVPEAKTVRQRLEQQGVSVTVDQVGTQVLDEQAMAGDSSTNALSIVGKCLMAFLGFIAVIVGIGAFIGCIVSATYSAVNLEITDLPTMCTSRGWEMLVAALTCFAVFLPSVAVGWLASHVLFKVKGPAPWLCITAAIVEVVIIVAVTIMAALGEL